MVSLSLFTIIYNLFTIIKIIIFDDVPSHTVVCDAASLDRIFEFSVWGGPQ